MPMNERVIRADGLELAVQAFGDSGQPAVLLIMGAMASMLWWPEGFCERLADRRRYVLRYDNRDTGRSTTYRPGEPSYAFDDLADDAIRVLDGYGIPSAHLLGMSMGGMIAQLAALKHPERVASLTVISSSPFGEDTSSLPGASAAYMEHAAQFGQVDWTDRAQVIRAMAADSRMLAGPAHPFDEGRITSLIERDFDRARNFASVTNHFVLEGGEAWQGRLGEVRTPVLVIHGTADPIFPIEHGVALSKKVPGATLVRLEGSGHELHEADWDQIIAAIVAHTRR
jgi:pimeloyl-ACP methyl ester carboxylesterase